MKYKILNVILIFILILSCTKNENNVLQTDTTPLMDEIINDINDNTENQESIITWDNFDWITECDWVLSTLMSPPPEYLHTSPLEDYDSVVNFYKFDIPQDSDLYHVRYTSKYSSNIPEEYQPSRAINEYLFFASNIYIPNDWERIGEQIDLDYPLVGIWKTPFSTVEEYRLADTTRLISTIDNIYYMKINKQLAGHALPSGTYLLRQTGELEFESISSYPNGMLKIKVLNENTILLTPSYNYTAEGGSASPLHIRRLAYRIGEENNDE